MKTAIIYLHIIRPNEGFDPSTNAESGTYDDCAARFVETYKQFPAGAEHELVVVFTNGIPSKPFIYDGLNCRFLCYTGTQWCAGVQQWAARQIDCDFLISSTARTYFWKENWLKRLMDAREKYGDGLYGTMSSNEARPHIRTNFFGVHPDVLRSFPHPLLNREDTWRLESGDWNLSHQFSRDGKPSMLVTWDGEYDFPNWRKPDNIFRRGDQSNCLVFDRHSDIFASASDEEKTKLAKLSDGV